MANAGGPPPARALEVTDEQIAAAVNANLVTSIRLIRASLPSMQSHGWGRICCITSYSIKQPIPALALSNLARTGLWAWAKTAAADLFPTGVTLNLIAPGLHATDRVRELGGERAGVDGRPGRLRPGGGVPVLAVGRLHLRHGGHGRRGRQRRIAVGAGRRLRNLCRTR